MIRTLARPAALIAMLASTTLAQSKKLPIELVPRTRFVVGGGAIGAIDVHGKSERLITGGTQGDLVLQTHPGGEVLWRRQSGDHWFKAARFSPDGRFIVASGRNLTVWSVAGKKLHEWNTARTGPVPVTWSPDGKLLAFGAESGNGLKVVHTRTWKLAHHYQGVRWSECLMFTPDGKRLIAGTHKGDTLSFDLATGKRDRLHDGRKADEQNRVLQWHAGKLLRGYWKGVVQWGALRIRHGKYLYSAAAHGDRILTADGKHVRVWDREGKPTGELPFGAQAMRFEPDGKAVLLSTADHRLVRWDFDEIQQLRNPHPSRVRNLAFSRNSEHLCAAAAGSTVVQRCEVRTGVARECRGAHPLGPGPEGSAILVRDRQGLALRDGKTWRLLRRLPKEPIHMDDVDAYALAPDGRTLLLGENFFDTSTGKSVKTDHLDDNLEVTWSRQGHAAASYRIGIDSGSGLRVFDAQRKVVFKQAWESPSGYPSWGIAAHDFSPDGKFFAYLVWHREGPNKLHRLRTATMQPENRAEAPITWWRYLDDDFALAVSESGAELWDAKKLERLGVVGGKLGAQLHETSQLQLSPDRRWLAAAFRLHVTVFEIRRRK